MKTLMTIVAIFTASATFACGNFAGNFTCSNTDGSMAHETTIEQNGTTFTYVTDKGSATVYADGLNHQVPNNDRMENVNYIANCIGDSIIVKLKGDFVSSSTGMVFPFTARNVQKLESVNHISLTSSFVTLGTTQTTVQKCIRK